YTEAQLNACFAACRTLHANLPIEFILGHEEIAPQRKIDPGPAFPLEKLRDVVLVGREDLEHPAPSSDLLLSPEVLHGATVVADRLNFRRMPYASSELAAPPLRQGERLEVLSENGAWRKVRVTKEGRVHGDYILADE
ncbi:MAG: hypothetical protein AAFX85_13305, partial [Pseudomonadota bacterium]